MAVKTCPKGHTFTKSSDCPTCPVCEAARKPSSGFLAGLSAPARRALERAGIDTLAKLAKRTERELLALHGFGPSTLPKLKRSLADAGLSLRKADRTSAKPDTIDAYLATVPADRRAALEKVRKAIRSILPDAEECISYSMPAFRHGGHVVAGFLATSQGCSYFPFSGTTLATVAADVQAYSRTKSALHFDPKRPLPATLVRKLLKARIAETEGKGTAKGARRPIAKRSPARRDAARPR